MQFVLDLRAAGSSGAVVPARLTRGRLDELRFATRVTFLVHGFNVNRQQGTQALLGFAGRVGALDDSAAVAVLWPGDSQARALGYSFQRNDADDSAAALAQFIGDNLRARPRVAFVAHSLGCRVAMQAASRLAACGYPVGQLCLMAAAVDDDSLASSAVYRAAAQAATRVAVLHSRADTVLRFAYPLGDWLQAFVYGDEVSGAALGLRGPSARRRPGEGIPATVLATGIPQDRGVAHGDYLGDGQSAPKPDAAARYADAVLRGELAPAYR